MGTNQIKLNQIGLNRIKQNLIGSNWIKRAQTGSSRIKSDQTGSNEFLSIFKYPIGWRKPNWIKLGLTDLAKTWGWGLVPCPYPLFCYLWILGNLSYACIRIGWTFSSLFNYRSFTFHILFGLLYAISILTFISLFYLDFHFLYSILTFISLFYFDFHFPFLFWLLKGLLFMNYLGCKSY